MEKAEPTMQTSKKKGRNLERFLVSATLRKMLLPSNAPSKPVALPSGEALRTGISPGAWSANSYAA
ncbi:unnamed protein product [Fusarium graminearum]|uniref:Uncharacterized protein n=1 Tax=Gibberella zeae TaxID=5518 RepID=A0A4U9ELW4_GIBZA|nr:unnamed protein product [Fusarium graminearum]CAF3610835.1 unnamed protein product [Fusarium graminearum]CAF3635386.1 unnamed protein product [Fusarium graminearum]CAG1981153.1 unnamed protein product [Fusarium graminearum]CAG1983273.1 unnamed protein product [Fusarium graminearum]